MNRLKLLSFIVLIIVMIWLPRAYAEAVYLKNGKVMTGRIVEKNERFIVLKTGKGETAAETTIFLEDISHMESDEAYSKKVDLIPFELFKPEPIKLKLSQPFSVPGGTNLENVKNLVWMDQQARLNRLTEKKDLLSQQSSKKKETQAAPEGPPHKGDGSISGVVSLPEKTATTKKGNLYVYLLEETSPGNFSSGSNMFYTKINAKVIKSRSASYKIEHVPSGKYRVLAEWDIAPPSVVEEKAGDSKILRLLGIKGDYTGKATQMISLAVNEHKANINFKCGTFLSKSESSVVLEKNWDIQVKDLYYQKFPVQEGKFILAIKNTGDKLVPLIMLDVLINGEKTMPVPLEFRDLGPHEEKEFDISVVYEGYKRIMTQKSETGESVLKALNFKIIWPGTEEVEFEKVLYVI